MILICLVGIVVVGIATAKMLTATKQDKKKLPQTIVQTTEEQTSTAQETTEQETSTEEETSTEKETSSEAETSTEAETTEEKTTEEKTKARFLYPRAFPNVTSAIAAQFASFSILEGTWNLRVSSSVQERP